MQHRSFTEDIAVVVAHYLNNPDGVKPVEALVLAQLHIYLQMNKTMEDSAAIKLMQEPEMPNGNSH